MAENTESTFQPHSDEELARLLEEQMRVMRSAQPITASQPVAPVVPQPLESQAVVAAEEVGGIDDLFGALLEDTTDIPLVQVVEVEEIFVPSVDDNTLAHTQPITYIHEEVVDVVVVDDHIVVEDFVVEEVSEDAHVIAERILSEISSDGEIVATTISETAGSDPIPLMFGEAVVSEHVVAPVFAASMNFSPEGVILEDVALEESVVEDLVGETVASEESETPQLRSTNPINHINSFAPRPTFDELVFGVKSDD